MRGKGRVGEVAGLQICRCGGFVGVWGFACVWGGGRGGGHGRVHCAYKHAGEGWGGGPSGKGGATLLFGDARSCLRALPVPPPPPTHAPPPCPVVPVMRRDHHHHHAPGGPCDGAGGPARGAGAHGPALWGRGVVSGGRWGRGRVRVVQRARGRREGYGRGGGRTRLGRPAGGGIMCVRRPCCGVCSIPCPSPGLRTAPGWRLSSAPALPLAPCPFLARPPCPWRARGRSTLTTMPRGFYVMCPAVPARCVRTSPQTSPCQVRRRPGHHIRELVQDTAQRVVAHVARRTPPAQADCF